MHVVATDLRIDLQGTLTAALTSRLLRLGRIHVTNVDTVAYVVAYQKVDPATSTVSNLFSVLVNPGTNESREYNVDVGVNVGLQVAAFAFDGTPQSNVPILADATIDLCQQ